VRGEGRGGLDPRAGRPADGGSRRRLRCDIFRLVRSTGQDRKDLCMILSHRRRLLGAALALPFAGSAFAQLTCGRLTARQTEGPFFKTDTPQRSSLLEKGDKNVLVVSGLVLSAQCKPVTHALLDFWHADELGDYDNQGFRYRGHQFTDAQGRFRLETIVPAQYPGRARHIHGKVQPRSTERSTPKPSTPLRCLPGSTG